MISNCDVLERIDYLKVLMQYIKVDSYGQCENNRVAITMDNCFVCLPIWQTKQNNYP